MSEYKYRTGDYGFLVGKKAIYRVVDDSLCHGKHTGQVLALINIENGNGEDFYHPCTPTGRSLLDDRHLLPPIGNNLDDGLNRTFDQLEAAEWTPITTPPKIGEDVIGANSFGYAAVTYLGDNKWPHKPEGMIITHYKYIRNLPKEINDDNKSESKTTKENS